MAVYFIRPIGMPGPVKIGWADWPQSRLDTLSTWSPFPLEIVASVEDGDAALERRLHGLFAEHHTHREWFTASDALSALIESLRAGRPIKDLIDMECDVLPFRAPRKRSAEFRQRVREAMHVLAKYISDKKLTQAAFAKALGKIDEEGNGKQSYVSMLLHRLEKGRPVPADICPKIEEATGGEIPAHELRPDVFVRRARNRKAA